MSNKLYDESSISAIADAIRYKGVDGIFKVAEMADAIKSIESSVDPPTHEWIRPETWPALDKMGKTEEAMYLTYDCRYGKSLGEQIDFYAIECETTTGIWQLDIGKIVDGEFVSTGTYTANNGNPIDGFLPIDSDDFIVIRIKPGTDSNHITRFCFSSPTLNLYGYYQDNSTCELQKCKEMYGYLPYVSKWGEKNAYRKTTCRYVERISVDIGVNVPVTTLRYAWYADTMLQSLDLSGWDTSNWTVTDMYGIFMNCYLLQYLDLSGWDTSNWAVTNLQFAWSGCYSLQTLDLSGWDTSNWVITSMYGTWQNCCALQTLDLSGWDTSNWAVTNLQYTWYCCYSLQYLDLSGWDTSNWAVTTLFGTWQSCLALTNLDLSSFDTSNWAVTNINGEFSSCVRLKHFKPMDKFFEYSMTNFFNYGSLTHDSLLNIVNALPTTTKSVTCTFGAQKAKLSDEEIAIATEKGWTIA